MVGITGFASAQAASLPLLLLVTRRRLRPPDREHLSSCARRLVGLELFSFRKTRTDTLQLTRPYLIFGFGLLWLVAALGERGIFACDHCSKYEPSVL